MVNPEVHELQTMHRRSLEIVDIQHLDVQTMEKLDSIICLADIIASIQAPISGLYTMKIL
jgi:hypothetical protein